MSASAGRNSSCGRHSGGGGDGRAFTGLYAVGVRGSLRGSDMPWGVGLFAVPVCTSPGAGGNGSRAAGLSLGGACGFPGEGVGACRGARGCMRWASLGHRVEGGKRGKGEEGRGLRVAGRRSCSCVAVRTCGADLVW